MNEILFVDDEPNLLQGLQRQLRPMHNVWNMHFVDSGAQALDLMLSNPVDIIITDMKMPGIDGAELLNQVARLYPNTVRIVLSGHADWSAVLRLANRAHQYLLKPAEPEELRHAIERAVTIRKLLANEHLQRLAASIKCLPSQPHLHTELIAELSGDEASFERVVEIISHDLGMNTKVLQLVNSSYFGLPSPVARVGDAVQHIGLATVKSLALSIKIFSQFDPNHCPGFSLTELTDHSWLTGKFARLIAHEHGMKRDFLEQCFTAGMLHDVGKLLFAATMPHEYSDILRFARETKRPLWECETERLGASHAEAGAYLLALWGLPPALVEAVANHHNPCRSIPETLTPTIFVHVGGILARTLDETVAEAVLKQLDEGCLEQLGLTEEVPAWREICKASMAA
jgi:HD-like signal output (HDOD) protein/CheY-like chemotaxis protein